MLKNILYVSNNKENYKKKSAKSPCESFPVWTFYDTFCI